MPRYIILLVSIISFLPAATAFAAHDTATVCQRGNTIKIDRSALAEHLGPDDYEGPCRDLNSKPEYAGQGEHLMAEPALPDAAADRLYRYLYYPNAEVYFDQDRELYFYAQAGHWVDTPSLPDSFKRPLTDFIILERAEPTPAAFHVEILAQYEQPPPATGFPWQAAPGQVSYQFLYYPDAEVYFYPEREYYFYTVDAQWVKAPTLQVQLQEKLGDFIVLEMATEHPYEFHPHIVEYYSAGVSSINEIQPQAELPPPANYHYRYYPDRGVYYDEIRRIYFYKEREHWVHSPSPAQTILSALGSFISFTLHTPRPYERHTLITRVHRLGAVRLSAKVHRYHYYPNVSVYHDVDRAVYHYRSKNRWHTVKVLPPSIVINVKQSISLNLTTNRPYLFNHHIGHNYAKYSGKQKTQVKVKIDVKGAGGGKVKIDQKIHNKVKIKYGKQSHKQAKNKNQGKNKNTNKSNKEKNGNRNAKGKGKGKGKDKGKDKGKESRKSKGKSKEKEKGSRNGKNRSKDKGKSKDN